MADVFVGAIEAGAALDRCLASLACEQPTLAVVIEEERCVIRESLYAALDLVIA